MDIHWGTLQKAADYLDTLADIDAGDHLDVADVRGVAESLRERIPPETRLRLMVADRGNVGDGWTFDLCRSGAWMWCKGNATVYATPYWADDGLVALSSERYAEGSAALDGVEQLAVADAAFPKQAHLGDDLDRAFTLYVGIVRGYIAGVGL